MNTSAPAIDGAMNMTDRAIAIPHFTKCRLISAPSDGKWVCIAAPLFCYFGQQCPVQAMKKADRIEPA
jgi:hypothetical protein